MSYTPCIPDETIFTVEDYKTAVKGMLVGEFGSGVREIQFSDKRAVFRSTTELAGLIQLMKDAIWGHCNQRGQIRRSSVAISSKGL